VSRSDLPFVWTSAIVFTALLAFAVLAFGGTEPWAMGIVETGIVLIAGTWGLRMAIAPYTLATDISQWPLALAVVWCAAQFVFAGTVYAFATAQATLQWCTYFLIFSIALQLFRYPAVRTFFLNFLLLFGTAVSIAAVLQRFAAPGKIYGIFETRSGTAFGPFVNPDHYCVLMELIFPIALYRTITDRSQALIYALVSGGIYGSVMLAGSRAGTGLLTLEAIFIYAAAYRSGMLRVSFRLAAAQVVVVMVLFTVLVGPRALSKQFADPNPLSMRRVILASSIDQVRARPLFGWGVGTFQQVYPAYSRAQLWARVDHAHNDWAEWAAGGGIPFLLLLLVFSALVTRPAIETIWGVGVVAVLLHALVDFPFQIPGLAALTFAVMAAAVSVPSVILRSNS
jgi:O-antigen ligase